MQFQIDTCWEDHQHRADVCLVTHIHESSREVTHGFASLSGCLLLYWGKSSWGGPAWPRSRVTACTGLSVLLRVSAQLWAPLREGFSPSCSCSLSIQRLVVESLCGQIFFGMDHKGWSSIARALNDLLKDPLFAGWLQWEPREAPRLSQGPYLSWVT